MGICFMTQKNLALRFHSSYQDTSTIPHWAAWVKRLTWEATGAMGTRR